MKKLAGDFERFEHNGSTVSHFTGYQRCSSQVVFKPLELEDMSGLYCFMACLGV